MLKLGAYVVDRRPLSVPAFRRLWVASAVSAVGGSFSLVAVPAQLFTLTGSSAFVGLSAAVSLCALTGSALWAGVLADSMDRGRPLLAGVLIPLTGVGTLYLLDALALTTVLWAAARLPAMPPRHTTRQRLSDGFRYLAGHPILVALLAADLAAMVFAMPVALLPELAEHTYGGPPGGGMELGLLFAAYPTGVLLAGLLSGKFSRTTRHGRLMTSAAMAWGTCVVVLGLAADLWLALAALFAGGAVNFVLSTFRNAIAQAYTDDALRGRIQGSLTVVLIGGPQLANLMHGFAGATFGPHWTISVGGALTVIAVALLTLVVPQLWHYEAEGRRSRQMRSRDCVIRAAKWYPHRAPAGDAEVVGGKLVSERARLRELERENRELKTRNEFLGKAAAFFAQEYR